MTNNHELGKWVKEMEQLCAPTSVIWVTGSEDGRKRLEDEAQAAGAIIKLHPEKLPGCFYHRTKINDVARTEHLTYICSENKEDAGPTNNWMSPEEGYRRASEILKGSMKGRKMYVIPFSMGPVDSPFSKIGVQLTDSVYVVINMLIMTRVGSAVLDKLGENGSFTKCMHGKAGLEEDKRLILHFTDDNAIWSVGSGYGCNALLGKKCLSLRIASALARKEGWLAEHMLILGVEYPDGHIEYVAASFPSACGKTNLAMLIPPAEMQAKGYRYWMVGDDIAWLRIGPDGRLWAVNPEAGFFGVAPGTNSKTNPNAVAAIQKNTIYTNVVIKDDLTVWWEGADGEPPASGMDWQGNVWKAGMKDSQGKPVTGAHPNSRFTAPASQCPCISPKWEDPQGVPLSAIIFGGKRASLVPLVYQSLDWNHGVYVGATMASERTAAQVGKQGEVRRDPMAMLPFCGYHIADYFSHWLEMGKKIPNPPKIFNVNWFRTDDNGKFLWPGYGENSRVVEWILRRCRNEGEATQTPIGYIPAPDALDINGLNLSEGALEKLLEVRSAEWQAEVADQKVFLDSLGPRLPAELRRQNEELGRRLSPAAATSEL